jgi:hypothetical protein
MTGTNLKEGMRVFSYTLSGFTEATTSSFPFVDSTGEEIYCNYFKVQLHFHPDANQSNVADHVVAYIEIPNSATNGIDQNLQEPYTSLTDVSAFCGGIAVGRASIEGVFEWKSPNDERINGIKIHIDEDYDKADGEIWVFLTYGNITPFNTLRLDRYDRGV